MGNTEVAVWANRVVSYDVKDPADLLPHPGNYRRHPAQQREALRGSLNELGVIAPVLVNRLTGHLLDGHARVEEYLAAGLTGIPVAYVEVPPEKESLALLSLDPIAAMAEADKEALAALLSEVETTEDGLAALFRDLAAELHLEPTSADKEDPGAETNRAEEMRDKWQTEHGQIWQAGVHRVGCGDCRDPEALARLMGRRRAEVLWTDPPYGVNYVGATVDALTIENDAPEGLSALLVTSFASAQHVLAESARFYIAAPAGPMGTVFRLAIAEVGWRLHQVLVWVKHTFVLGHSDYHYRHEDILYGFTPGPGRPGRGAHEGTRWYGGHDQDTVFEVDRPVRSELHPTMKPPELIAPMLRNSAPVGGAVLDPFCGSGSTLVACEQTRRTGFGLDVDPRYVAVTLERLSNMGLEPRLT